MNLAYPGNQRICASAVPHPLCTLTFDLEKGELTMIEEKDCQENCGFKSYSSGDFKHERTLAYNYNVHAVNCEKDWKVSGLYSISVVSSKYIFHDNVSYSQF